MMVTMTNRAAYTLYYRTYVLVKRQLRFVPFQSGNTRGYWEKGSENVSIVS
jgi:hypothetical protein